MGKTIDVKFKGAKGKVTGGDAGSILKSLAITVVFALVYFYIALPAINLHSKSFYFFVFIVCAVFCATRLFSKRDGRQYESVQDLIKVIKEVCLVPAIICVSLIVIYLLGSLFSSVIFRAHAYSRIMDVEPGNFAEEIDEISFDQIPMLDKTSAQRLGDRKLGELSDMVSQFEVASDYTQINYKGRPVRLATLEYGNIFKWLKNRRNGIPAYITIDMVTQNVNVVRLQEGIRYTNCEHFSRLLDRYIRFKYPTYMFDTPHMELDEEGTPWWICPRIVKTIGLFGGTTVKGIVLVNAVTGETDYYPEEEIPAWADQVFSADLIVQQYDYHGTYLHGFFNSLFAQTGVTVTTEGYNYIAIDDDVYTYTGITSVGGDQSNIGFILTNMRTRETRYYSCAGAKEYSAMSSAEGIVQQMEYVATFPLLLNIADQPTYFIALKDHAGLVKMYAMVNVQQYNIVAIGSTVAECEADYVKQLTTQGVINGRSSQTEVSGTIEEIRTAIIDGNSIYYFKLSGKQEYYAVSASDCEEAVLLSTGDNVTVFISGTELNGIVRAHSIIKK